MIPNNTETVHTHTHTHIHTNKENYRVIFFINKKAKLPKY